MSLQGQVGAESAAEDIIRFVRKRIEALGPEAESCPERGKAHEVLVAVLTHANGIRDAAKAGWY